ncbi:hypothetical protein [Salmonella enterica]
MISYQGLVRTFPKRSHKDPGRSLRFTWQSV